MLLQFRKIDRELEGVELVWTKTDGTKYNFNHFLLTFKFIEKIHNYEITLNIAINDQTEIKILINKLNDYNPTKPEKIEEKKRVLKSAKKLFDARDEIINLFGKGIFPYKGNLFKTKEKEESEESEEKKESEEKLYENKFFKNIENESEGINYDLFEKHFKFKLPSILAKTLLETKNKRKNNDLVSTISSGLIDWKNEIEKMPK